MFFIGLYKSSLWKTENKEKRYNNVTIYGALCYFTLYLLCYICKNKVLLPKYVQRICAMDMLLVNSYNKLGKNNKKLVTIPSKHEPLYNQIPSKHEPLYNQIPSKHEPLSNQVSEPLSNQVSEPLSNPVTITSKLDGQDSSS
jgi:hypothetical protein